MDIEIVKRICLARHLYDLALSALKSENDLYLFSCANLLQDAVEAFFLAIADYVNADIDSNTKYDKYFVLINEKISPKELPFKAKLLRLNRIRIDSKHYAIQPTKDELQKLSIAVRELFEEVCNSILQANFSTLSTIDLLKDGKPKSFLLEAKAELENGSYEKCSIACRKAIYLELEKDYDISFFREGAKPKNTLAGLLGPRSKAPYFCQNNDYIVKHVRDPTDYIVYDHSSLDQELLKYSIDNTAFWNVWRLTPEVFLTEDDRWVVKYDFAKLDEDVLKDKIEYIFSTTIDIIYSIHVKRESIRTKDYRSFYLEIGNEEIPVYERADKASKVVGITPKGITKLDCDYYVEGLNDGDIYWRISHHGEGVFLYGFIHNEHIKG
jgi:hypothetical protein